MTTSKNHLLYIVFQAVDPKIKIFSDFPFCDVLDHTMFCIWLHQIEKLNTSSSQQGQEPRKSPGFLPLLLKHLKKLTLLYAPWK